MSCSSITSLCINEEGIIFLGYSDGTLGVTVCSLYYKILDEERRRNQNC